MSVAEAGLRLQQRGWRNRAAWREREEADRQDWEISYAGGDIGESEIERKEGWRKASFIAH